MHSGSIVSPSRVCQEYGLGNYIVLTDNLSIVSCTLGVVGDITSIICGMSGAGDVSLYGDFIEILCVLL